MLWSIGGRFSVVACNCPFRGLWTLWRTIQVSTLLLWTVWRVLTVGSILQPFYININRSTIAGSWTCSWTIFFFSSGCNPDPSVNRSAARPKLCFGTLVSFPRYVLFFRIFGYYIIYIYPSIYILFNVCV